MHSEKIPQTSEPETATLFFILGLCVVGVGLLFYAVIRTDALPLLDSLAYPIIKLDARYSFLNSFPTFVHSVGFSFLTLAFIHQSFRNIILVALLWAVVNVSYEYHCLSIMTFISNTSTQDFSCTYDDNDVIASLLGAVVFIMSSYTVKRFFNINRYTYENDHEK